MLVYNKTTQECHERQISGLKQVNKNNKRTGNDEKYSSITACTYSREEWSKLSNKQREKIKELRTRKKRAKKDQNQNPKTVKKTASTKDAPMKPKDADSDKKKQRDDRMTVESTNEEIGGQTPQSQKKKKKKKKRKRNDSIESAKSEASTPKAENCPW